MLACDIMAQLKGRRRVEAKRVSDLSDMSDLSNLSDVSDSIHVGPINALTRISDIKIEQDSYLGRSVAIAYREGTMSRGAQM